MSDSAELMRRAHRSRLPNPRRVRSASIGAIAARPAGLAMITGLDPASTILAENFAVIVAQFTDISVPLDRAAQIEQLARADNDWAAIESYLPAPA